MQDSQNVVFYEFVNAENNYKSVIGIDLNSDKVFVPGVIHPGGEDAAFFCAAHDCISICRHENSLFVESDWMKGELKNDKQYLNVIVKMEKSVRKAAKEDPQNKKRITN